MAASTQSTYVRVAPSPRLRDTQTAAAAELVQLRVRHLLPQTTQRAKERVGLLKKVFSIAPDVIQRAHEAALGETLERLRLVKSVRNIKVQGSNGGGGASGNTVAGALCLPFHSCAALPAVFGPAASAEDAAAASAYVLTGSVDGLLTLWDAEHCTPLCSQSTYPMSSHGWGRVRSIAVFPQTSTAASAPLPSSQCFAFTASMFQQEVRVWRITQEGEAAQNSSTVAEEDTHAKPALALHPLTTASTATEAGSVGATATTSSVDGGLQHVAVDPTGALLAATHANGTVHLWDARSVVNGLSSSSVAGSAAMTVPPLAHLYEHDGYETSGSTLGLAFHPDGSLLTTTDAGGRVVAWDTRSGQLAFHTGGRVGGHLRAALCVAWSPCGVRLASGGADGVVHLYDARKLSKAGLGPHNDSSAAPFQMLGHDDAVTSLSFYTNPIRAPHVALPRGSGGSGSGSASALCSVLPVGLVTTSLDHTLRLWDADTGLCVRTVDAGMPLHDQCRPALQPLSDRYSTSTAVMAVGHGKNWLMYDVGLRGEELAEDGGLAAAHNPVSVTENDVVASATGEGGSGGMRFAVGTGAAARPTASDNEEGGRSSSEESDDDDEMMALRRQKATLALPAKGTGEAAEEDDDASSEDEMEMLKKKN